MENNNSIEIGYLEITSWEHLAATGLRYCYGVEQLEWVLPDETTAPLKRLLGLWQEILLQDCIPLSPLVDSGHRKQKIYLKSSSFKKRIKDDNIDYFNRLPALRLYLNNLNAYFSSFLQQDSFTLGKILDWEVFDLGPNPNWGNYVLENSGYLTGRFHGKNMNLWIPGSDDKLTAYYRIDWRTHFFQDKILEQILDDNN